MSADFKLSKVQKKGQVTIPIEIRKRLGIEEGDYVTFIETDVGVIVTRQEVIGMAALDRIGEMLREQGRDLYDVIESGREIRGDLIKEKYGLSDDDASVH